MATRSLATMSVDALLKLRNDIGEILARRSHVLKEELRSLGSDYAEVGRIALYGKKKAGAMAAAEERPPRKVKSARRTKRRTSAAASTGHKTSKRRTATKSSRRKSAKRK
jgi:hypothetical protein